MRTGTGASNREPVLRAARPMHSATRLGASALAVVLLVAGGRSSLAEAAEGDDAWPSFRGPRASGVADGQSLPDRWSGVDGTNIRWRAAIPGLAHSSPIVRDGRVFVTSAISADPEATFRPGLYGAGTASPDRSPQRWMVYALDAETGAVLWEAAAAEGRPRDARHIKNTYASATPATDGRYVVALFGSQGLHAFDMDGRRVWTKDLGRLDAGAYDVPQLEWGPASSPIIVGDLVVVQCDTQGESFLLAADVRTGETVWRTPRDELPSWGTPSVYDSPAGTAIVTNGSNFIRGYDLRTGRERWRLGGSSRITAPTPVVAGELLVVASGRAPEAPLFAVRAAATGDITLGPRQASSPAVAWRHERRGPYMPTPIVYRGRLYALHDAGILDAYDVGTGAEIYRRRIPHAGFGFSASPVAADGRLYLSGEDGVIFVVRAGARFDLLAANDMGEPLMATPALAGGVMYVRGARHLFAVAGT